MSYEPPSPDNNLLLRQMAGMRKDMLEVMTTNARVIELLGRMNLRLDESAARQAEALARIERRLHDTQSDMILMENRIITAIAEVRNLAGRLDESDASDLSDDDKPRPAPASPAGRHG